MLELVTINQFDIKKKIKKKNLKKILIPVMQLVEPRKRFRIGLGTIWS